MRPERHLVQLESCGSVDWGGRCPRIDYDAHELALGNFHFLCTDMGFRIPLGLQLRTALGEPDKIDRNPRACAPGAGDRVGFTRKA